MRQIIKKNIAVQACVYALDKKIMHAIIWPEEMSCHVGMYNRVHKVVEF